MGNSDSNDSKGGGQQTTNVQKPGRKAFMLRQERQKEEEEIWGGDPFRSGLGSPLNYFESQRKNLFA